MILLNIAALIVGGFRFESNPWPMGANMFWCFYHLMILAQIFRYNKLPQLEVPNETR